ncbi:MAG: hypothetical protein Q4F65_05590 [Propionibacteriaceae bacterium]|nr:hypothetical protein [Propionibacteriaceae bacterium]
MPSRIYRGKIPPSRLDHLLAHPYEIPLAIFGFLACLGVLVAELVPPISVSPTIDGLNGVIAWLVGALGIVGNVLVVKGLLDDGPDLMPGWQDERTGLALAGASWAIYAVSVALTFPGSVVSWAIAAVVACSHATRLRATFAEEEDVRDAVQRHGEAA